MFIIPTIDDNEKPGYLVGRVLRTDTNAVLDYHQVSLNQTGKDDKPIPPEKIRTDFENFMKTKAEGFHAKIKGMQRGTPLNKN